MKSSPSERSRHLRNSWRHLMSKPLFYGWLSRCVSLTWCRLRNHADDMIIIWRYFYDYLDIVISGICAMLPMVISRKIYTWNLYQNLYKIDLTQWRSAFGSKFVNDRGGNFIGGESSSNDQVRWQTRYDTNVQTVRCMRSDKCFVQCVLELRLLESIRCKTMMNLAQNVRDQSAEVRKFNTLIFRS